MTNQEAKQRLERIWKDYTSAYDTVPIEDLLAFDMATNALGAIDQIQWERDLAIKQLHDLGYGLGEKPREELNNSSQEVKNSNWIYRQATKHMDLFTKTYCRDNSIIDELVFRCSECEFEMPDGKRLVKCMARKICPDYKGFGCMGDL